MKHFPDSYQDILLYEENFNKKPQALTPPNSPRKKIHESINPHNDDIIIEIPKELIISKEMPQISITPNTNSSNSNSCLTAIKVPLYVALIAGIFTVSSATIAGTVALIVHFTAS